MKTKNKYKKSLRQSAGYFLRSHARVSHGFLNFRGDSLQVP